MNTEKEPEPCPGCTDGDCPCDGLSEGRLLMLRLEAAQTERGLQWRDVASVLGVAPSTVAGWRKAGRVPDGRVESVESWLASPGYSGPSAVEAMDASAEVVRLEARVAELEADVAQRSAALRALSQQIVDERVDREDLADVRVVIQCALTGWTLPKLAETSEVAREAAAALAELRARSATTARAGWTWELQPYLPPQPDPPPARLTAEELEARAGLLDQANRLRRILSCDDGEPTGIEVGGRYSDQDPSVIRVARDTWRSLAPAIEDLADALERQALDLSERVGGGR